jgi:hypothetical protein
MWWQAEREREKAEKERDEARATKDMHKRRADEERARAEKAEQERDEAREARTVYLPGPPRPLSPDAITTTFAAMVAKMLSDRGHGWVPSHYLCESMRGAAAALTKPPARPEGAEDVAVRLFQAGAAVGVEMTEEQRDALADHLAAMRVRVVGEDGAA